MVLKLLFTSIFVLGSWVCYGQQDPIYAQYINNPLVLNPAYTGINNNLTAALGYRAQWVGHEGAPHTANFNAHSSFFDNKVGAGLMVIQDHFGITSNTEVHLTYSYKIEFSDFVFSFGLQTGFFNLKNDFGGLNPEDPTDDIFLGEEQITRPNFGAGIALKGERFFIGLSVPRILQTTIDNGNLNGTLYDRHFYQFASVLFNVAHNIQIKPSVLMRVAPGSPFSVDYNASVVFQNRYQAGLLSRNFHTYGLTSQMVIGDGFRVGYIFEIPTAKSVGLNFTTHELTLAIDLGLFDFHTIYLRNF